VVASLAGLHKPRHPTHIFDVEGRLVPVPGAAGFHLAIGIWKLAIVSSGDTLVVKEPGMSQAILVILVIAVVAVIAIVGQMQVQRRRSALAAWASANGLSFNPNKDPSLGSQQPFFKCLQQGDDRYGYNIIRGKWDNRQLLIFDYHYETHSTNSKGQRQTHHHKLSCVLVSSPFPLEPLLIRPEGLWDKVTEFFGADDIDFESAEFSRKFYVKSPDRKWAYDVIHQRTMEFLLSRPQYTVEFSPLWVMARQGENELDISEIQSAVDVACGILDALPDYVIRQQKEQMG
jgi:hypothetical protein